MIDGDQTELTSNKLRFAEANSKTPFLNSAHTRNIALNKAEYGLSQNGRRTRCAPTEATLLSPSGKPTCAI
jgi:hypothetical protein